MNATRSHRRFEELPKDQIINEHVACKKYLEIDLAQIIDRDTVEGKRAWAELCSHHCIPYAKNGRWVLDQFFRGDEEPDAESGRFYLYPLVMNYLNSIGVNPDDFDDVLMNFDW